MRIAVVGVLMVGACNGGSHPHRDDARSADSAPADVLADSNAGSATVIVRGLTRPNRVANAPVLFTDTAGVSTEAHTDAMGQATGLIPPGGSVTAMLDDSHYATIAGAMPGDHLTFGLGRFGYGGDLAVTFSAYAPNATYRLYTPCMSFNVSPPTTTVTLDLCNGPISDTDIYIVASTSTAVATAAAHHVDLTTGTVTVPDAWTPLRTIDLSFTGFSVSQSLSVGAFDVPELYSGGPGAIDQPNVTLTLPATAPAQLIRTDVEDNLLRTSQHQSFIDRVDSTATTYTLSAAELRSWITGVSYDAATRTIAATAPAAQPGDIVMYELDWTYLSTTQLTWDVYMPAFEPFTLPALPADMPEPTNGPDLRLTKVVVVWNNSSVTSWNDARPRVFDLATQIPDPANVPDRLYLQAFEDP